MRLYLDSTEEESDDASLPWNVEPVPGGRRHELHHSLHPAGPLKEGQELLALLPGNVGDPVRTVSGLGHRLNSADFSQARIHTPLLIGNNNNNNIFALAVRNIKVQFKPLYRQ